MSINYHSRVRECMLTVNAAKFVCNVISATLIMTITSEARLNAQTTVLALKLVVPTFCSGTYNREIPCSADQKVHNFLLTHQMEKKMTNKQNTVNVLLCHKIQDIQQLKDCCLQLTTVRKTV